MSGIGGPSGHFRPISVGALIQRLLHNYVREWDPDGIRTVRLGDASTRHKRLEVPEFKRLNRQFKSFIAFDPSLLSFTDFHL